MRSGSGVSVIDALAGAVDGGGARSIPAPSFQGEAVVERLLADLGSLEQPAVLVIDDLHELRSVDALAVARPVPRPAAATAAGGAGNP